MPMDSKRTSLEIGLNDLISYFLYFISQMLELVLFSELLLCINYKVFFVCLFSFVFPYYKCVLWKCYNRDISKTFMLTEIWPFDLLILFVFNPIQAQNIIISLHTVKALLPKPTSFAEIVTCPDICSPFQSKHPNCYFRECPDSRLLIHCIFLCHPNFHGWLKKGEVNKRSFECSKCGKFYFTSKNSV